VITGKPNCGEPKPSGMGAGVVCSFASFAASKSPETAEDEAERPRFTKSVARKEPLLVESVPWA
jgi:hypothetical protein